MTKYFYFRIAAAMLMIFLTLVLCWVALKYCPFLVTTLGVWLIAAIAGLAMLLIYAWAFDQPLVDKVFDHVND